MQLLHIKIALCWQSRSDMVTYAFRSNNNYDDDNKKRKKYCYVMTKEIFCFRCICIEM